MAPDNPQATHDNICLPTYLDQVRIRNLPSVAYYITDFITEDEECIILEKTASAPKPRWKQLTHRRLQTWPSDLVNNKLIDAPLPAWLEDPILSRLKSLPLSEESNVDIFHDSPHGKPNHVLVNEYPPGVGIMPHKDGAAYYPVVATVSLGAGLCLDIYKTKSDGTFDTDPAWRVFQEPRSLLITSGTLYTEFLHGIASIDVDDNLSGETVANWELLRSVADLQDGKNLRKTRTSLTYRDVKGVSKLGNKFGMFHKK
ncbi:Alkbh6 protein [Xylariomycetidae sp. FL2044]|nr:Alkbh6 protein [Xylariomycetidae sp. FL2044]